MQELGLEGSGSLGVLYHMRKYTRQEEQGIQLGWSEEYVKQG